MTLKSDLKKVLKLVKDIDHWIQGQHAIDANGVPVPPHWKEATCFCLDGAMGRIAGFCSPKYIAISHAIEAACYRRFHTTSYVSINDGYHQDLLGIDDRHTASHEAVVKIVQEAIAAA